MNYMLIDTAEGTRVLLKAGDEYYYEENLKRVGSEILLPTIDCLLRKSGVALGDIDILGACVGPGSFTGLRIGLTTVKTFCYGLGKPCFAVNNLRLNSYNNKGGKVISIADAGNNVCYIARYDGDSELDQPKCVTKADAIALTEAYPDFSVSTDMKLSGIVPRARSGVGRREMIVAAEKHIVGAIDQKELLPLYIRKAQPERGEGDL